MRDKITVRGLAFENTTLDGAVALVNEYIDRKEQCVIYTPNAEIVQMTVEDPEFKRTVASADILIPDGAGVVLASKIMGKPLKAKVPGCELAERLVAEAAAKGHRIFFYGSKPVTDAGISVAELAEKRMSEKYPGFRTVGTSHGYVKPDGYDALIETVNSSDADILFVCLGVPMQEKWIEQNRDKLGNKVIIGLGGTLDVFAGTVKRAPDFFVKANLEWFYRLIKEPKRLGRMMKLPKFILGAIFIKED